MGKGKGSGPGRPSGGPREYLSGGSKAKRRKEQQERDAKVIAQTRRMTDFMVQPERPNPERASPEELQSDSSMEPEIHSAADSLSVSIPHEERVVEIEHAVVSGSPSDDRGSDVESGRAIVTASGSPGAVQIFSNDTGAWPIPITADIRRYWARKGSSECQYRDADFTTSGRQFGNESYNRYCQRSFFHRPAWNLEDGNREWLCFSPSQRQLFCFHCKLTGGRDMFGTSGFADWKNGNTAIVKHENSTAHRQAVLDLINIRQEGACVDTGITRHIESQQQYWRNILQRIVAVIKFLAERGLAFRGSDEIVGSPYNGNYLGLIELVGEFDALLADHIGKHANKGRGHTNYLSSTTCDEFIDILGQAVLSTIVSEVKNAKYYSISLDSTPDVSHQDQLVCIIRYVDEHGPVERFLKFLNARGHTAQELTDTLFEFLMSLSIDIADCRGQSYDNAANMAGKYAGVQKLVLNKNPLAVFIPCCNHSLNLVGRCAVAVCQDAVAYFEFVQNLYKFFAASTHKYELLVQTLKPLNLPVVKRLSDTRWSAHADAVKAIARGYRPLCNLLLRISIDPEEKPNDQAHARALSKQMLLLETGILTELWWSILSKINAVTKRLQSTKMHLNQSVALLQALLSDLSQMQNNFDLFEKLGKERSGENSYEERRAARARHNSVVESASTNFKERVYLPILSKLVTALRHRLSAYEVVSNRFGFLSRVCDMDARSIEIACNKLIATYVDDLSDSLVSLMQLFAAFAKGQISNQLSGRKR